MGSITFNNTFLNTFLFCLLFALTPYLFWCYLAMACSLPVIFLVICLIDFIKGSSYRKSAGIIMAAMMLAAIASLLFYYITIPLQQ